MTAKLDSELDNSDKPLVVQFAVKHEQRIDCGGGYIKLMSKLESPDEFSGDTEYEIMFGPDICGATKRVHTILRKPHEKDNLLINKEARCPADEYTHFYTFELNPDGTFDVLVDGESKQKGDVKEFWDFELPKEINDPDQSKPDDWDQPEQIVDPTAEKPDDWDDEDDGEWEAPMVDNPDYKGPWSPKMIDNPDYKGRWEHPMIPNPEYAYDDQMHAVCKDGCTHVGFEIWQVKSGTVFDDILVTDSLEEAQKFAGETFFKKKDGEKDMFDAAEKKREEEAAREDEEDMDDMDDMGMMDDDMIWTTWA